MNNAWRMHTEDFQMRFSRDYKDFFNTHNMVLSAPGILTWWADISHVASVLRIKQKIPLKSYIGVNFKTSWAVTFGTIFTYDILSDTFRKNPFKTVFQHDISSVISCLEAYFLEKKFTSGISIDFLSEAPPGHGFAFSSVVAFSLLLWPHILLEKLMQNHSRHKDCLQSLHCSNHSFRWVSNSHDALLEIIVSRVGVTIRYSSPQYHDQPSFSEKNTPVMGKGMSQ